jgi:hypothetical protein
VAVDLGGKTVVDGDGYALHGESPQVPAWHVPA